MDCQSLIVHHQHDYCQRGTHSPEDEGNKKRAQCMLFVGQDASYLGTCTRRHNRRGNGQ